MSSGKADSGWGWVMGSKIELCGHAAKDAGACDPKMRRHRLNQHGRLGLKLKLIAPVLLTWSGWAQFSGCQSMLDARN